MSKSFVGFEVYDEDLIQNILTDNALLEWHKGNISVFARTVMYYTVWIANYSSKVLYISNYSTIGARIQIVKK